MLATRSEPDRLKDNALNSGSDALRREIATLEASRSAFDERAALEEGLAAAGLGTQGVAGSQEKVEETESALSSKRSQLRALETVVAYLKFESVRRQMEEAHAEQHAIQVAIDADAEAERAYQFYVLGRRDRLPMYPGLDNEIYANLYAKPPERVDQERLDRVAELHAKKSEYGGSLLSLSAIAGTIAKQYPEFNAVYSARKDAE